MHRPLTSAGGHPLAPGLELVFQRDGVIETVMALDVAGGRITRIWAVRNPEKLRTWTT
jgi:hypothetical protein